MAPTSMYIHTYVYIAKTEQLTTIFNYFEKPNQTKIDWIPLHMYTIAYPLTFAYTYIHMYIQTHTR